MNQVALIGYGGFGRALGSLLDRAGLGYRAVDPAADIPEPHRAETLPELLSGAELVVLAMPVQQLRSVLGDLLPLLRPSQLVLDVGSVKVNPVQVMTELLGARFPWVGTHPLFGPRSLALGETPLRVVVCPNDSHQEAHRRARSFYERLGCEVIEQTPEAHDRVMAHTHALTFFVAKGMMDMGMSMTMPFSPASFQALARTIAIVRSDAGHLFATIERENPFASEARRHLLAALTRVHRELEAMPPDPDAAATARVSIPALETTSPEPSGTAEDIDQLDRELLGLLARRARLSPRAAQGQAQVGQPVSEPPGDEALLARRRAWAAEQGLDEAGVEAVFRAMLRAPGPRRGS